MSTETLKFFEEKSTEAIINWMINHLTEEQIRMCLDQSGVPDTTTSPPTAPPAAASAAASSSDIQTVTLPDGTQMQVPQQAPDAPKKSAVSVTKKFLNKYRVKCENTQYLIKSVGAGGVQYYEFKEVDEEDLKVNPSLTEGEVAWTFQTKPISEFKDYCTEEDRELFQILKEENEEAFSNPLSDVLEVAADYVTSGLVSPIPIKTVPQAPDVSDPTPVAQLVEITESMMKALKVQQNSGSYIQQNYPELYTKGLTMFPVFIYEADGNKVLFMSAVVQGGKLVLVKDFVNKALINNKFRKVTEAISNAVAAGLYTPSDNIRTELSDSLSDAEIRAKIKFIYDQVKVNGINFYGTIDDEPENMSQDSFVDVQHEFPVYNLDNWPDTRAGMPENVQLKTKPKKKPTEMNETELKDHMTNIGYPHHLYYPEVYTNSLGVENVRYKKRESPLDNEDYEMVKNTPFVDFQGKPSMNSGPGKFGKEKAPDDNLLLGKDLLHIEGDEEDLLFD
jgi:hypothetical protein